MAYKSIDELQNLLSREVFGDRLDNKKAAGRALGTFIETIVFYLLRQWGYNDSIVIESPLSEYGREDIKHNVEFTLHPYCGESPVVEVPSEKPLTARAIAKACGISPQLTIANNKLVDRGVIQNACVIASGDSYIVLARPNAMFEERTQLHTYTLHKKPYAMIECKRVGKEGNAKGPQTIEKAKQGAYVAKTTSSLQKVRNDKGELEGVYFVDGKVYVGPYHKLLSEIVLSDNPKLLRDFILSIGVVSNHGNWFTAENQNKEMKVLAQSYDWLLFLTDDGLAQFITELLVEPVRSYQPIKDAFLSSYNTDASNSFTKKRMNLDAHFALDEYFTENVYNIERWFNVISPSGKTLDNLKQTLEVLKSKNWSAIL